MTIQACTLTYHIQAAQDENDISFIYDWFDCEGLPFGKVDQPKMAQLFTLGHWGEIQAYCMSLAASAAV